MDIRVFIPLIATIAYIPLLCILLVNRPWQKRQKLFFLFLISAMLWSLSAVFGRSDFFMQDKLLLVKVVLCLGMWSVIQFHYVLYSFYSTRFFKIPLGYILVIMIVTLAMLGYVPQSIDVTTSGTIVNYGIWFILVATLVSLLLVKDLHFLIRRRRILADPAERNQLSYLFLGIIVLLTIASICFAPVARGFPFPHVGNLLMACILTYAVVQHRLLDVRVVLHRALSSIAIVALIIAIYLLWMLLFGKVFHLKEHLSVTILALSLTLAIGIAFWQTLISEIFTGVDRLFYGKGLEPRRKLISFIDKIYSIPTLEQFGTQFVSLFAQAVGCQNACLLLPQAGETQFAARFSYPAPENNPLNSLRLKLDSPVVITMKEKTAILPTREIDILPEFGGMWLAEKEDIRAAKVELFIPLINRGEIVAILAVSHKRGGKLYRVEDIDLMESVAGRVAASIEKEHLHDQVEMQRKELALIKVLCQDIVSTPGA